MLFLGFCSCWFSKVFNEQEAAEGGAVLGRERYGSYELLCLVGKFDINSVVG